VLDSQALSEAKRVNKMLNEFKEGAVDFEVAVGLFTSRLTHRLEMERVAAGRDINAQLNPKCKTLKVLAPFEYFTAPRVKTDPIA
jgi:hypothetical protein